MNKTIAMRARLISVYLGLALIYVGIFYVALHFIIKFW